MAADKKRKRDHDTQEVSDKADAQDTSQGPSAKRVQQRRTLFVRLLPKTATTETLIALFSEMFPIRHATAVTDSKTKECKGFGFITFADAEDAARAQSEFNNSMVEGRRIKLEIAEPRRRTNEDLPEDVTIEDRPADVSRSTLREAKARREKETQEARKPPKLIVRNLPWTIKTSDDLSKLFMSFGKVKVSSLPTKKSGTLQGFGFVTLRGRKNAEKALAQMNGKTIGDRTVSVDWAVDKDTWERSQEKEDRITTNGEQVRENSVSSIDSGESQDPFDQLEPDDKYSGFSSDTENDEPLSDRADNEPSAAPVEDFTTTLFVRNLPFTCTDEELQNWASQFGKIRYARVVLDPNTERPRGTGFTCFYQATEALECLRNAPKNAASPHKLHADSKSNGASSSRSVLQSEEADPTGKYTLEGRVLQVSKAVGKSEATRLTEVGVASRHDRDKDKRRLYLLSEGAVNASSPLYDVLPQSEKDLRESSTKQRKRLVQNNPSLHLSLTRLSIRNIPCSISSKDLKALAREAVVGFAKDVKNDQRQPLSKEELSRDGQNMRQAERNRKLKGVGIVKQAKVVYEDREGHKVSEVADAGRSRGYGFIEYHSHRSALMGLRWLNGHAVKAQKPLSNGTAATQRPAVPERAKRMIVEFAIENAQVVNRRKDNEQRGASSRIANRDTNRTAIQARTSVTVDAGAPLKEKLVSEHGQSKHAHRQQIISRKRAIRRSKKESKSK
ncbi:MAG: RNA recognition motif-containing protein [Chrysothrix sp. TS-e1954]|nr:MAG: RNA recognition motif-containing protein [Chrysothrix sp. TS-e1954]